MGILPMDIPIDVLEMIHVAPCGDVGKLIVRE
jgi:hypothetical protein